MILCRIYSDWWIFINCSMYIYIDGSQLDNLMVSLIMCSSIGWIMPTSKNLFPLILMLVTIWQKKWFIHLFHLMVYICKVGIHFSTLSILYPHIDMRWIFRHVSVNFEGSFYRISKARQNNIESALWNDPEGLFSYSEFSLRVVWRFFHFYYNCVYLRHTKFCFLMWRVLKIFR